MLKKIVLLFAAVALAKAQIPSLGWCPEYVPMANFDINRFLGIWYEAERYFQLTEVISRCVTTNYTRGLDGKVRVSNEVTNRYTGVKRILEGEIKPAASKSEEGKIHVKYTSVPLTPETQYSVLETDYDNYAVLWSCSGIGPIHTQNAWLMTRQRSAPGDIMQLAYGVLDKYKIWKAPFVKTDQADCTYQVPEAPAVVVSAVPAPAAASAPAPASAPVVEAAVVQPAARKNVEGIHLRSAGTLPPVEAIEETRPSISLPEAPASSIANEPVKELPVADVAAAELPAAEEKPAADEIKPQDVEVKPIAPETIPEVILKVAEFTKEAVPVALSPEEPESNVNPAAAESQTVEVVAVPAEPKPEQLKAAEPVEETKPETAPVEKSESAEAAIKLAEEPKPVETPVASEVAEESKPLEQIPALRSSPISEVEKPLEEPAADLPSEVELPVAAVLLETVATKSVENIVPVEAAPAEEIKVVEVPAAPVAPVESPLLKALEVPAVEESKSDSAEPSLPAVIVEPVVAETPAVKAVEVAQAEEPKEEKIAELPKTVEEAKP